MVLVFWTKIGIHRLVRQIGGCGARQFVVGFEAPVPDGKVAVLEFKISFIRLKIYTPQNKPQVYVIFVQH